MRILVDTSVWSLALARRTPAASPFVERLTRAVHDGDVVMIGVVLQETLQAFRHERDFRRIARSLSAFPLLQLARSDYVKGAALHRACAAKGIAASTVDCQIAAAAVQNRCALLAADSDYERIARVCDLELVR